MEIVQVHGEKTLESVLIRITTMRWLLDDLSSLPVFQAELLLELPAGQLLNWVFQCLSELYASLPALVKYWWASPRLRTLLRTARSSVEISPYIPSIQGLKFWFSLKNTPPAPSVRVDSLGFVKVGLTFPQKEAGKQKKKTIFQNVLLSLSSWGWVFLAWCLSIRSVFLWLRWLDLLAIERERWRRNVDLFFFFAIFGHNFTIFGGSIHIVFTWLVITLTG